MNELTEVEFERQTRWQVGLLVLAALIVNTVVVALGVWMVRMDREDLWSPTPAGWPAPRGEPRQESASQGGVPLPQAWSPERVW